MHFNQADDRSSQADEQPLYEHEQPQNLMTPARRAALAAFEREFSDLLHARVTG
jgi:hypothetical protein